MPSLISTLNLFNSIDSDSAIKFYEYNSSSGVFSDPTSQISFKNNGDFSFNTTGGSGGTERMRILNTNGNVGIGTTSPSKPLEVKNGILVRQKYYSTNHNYSETDNCCIKMFADNTTINAPSGSGVGGKLAWYISIFQNGNDTNSTSYLLFRKENSTPAGYIQGDTANQKMNDFTGQHRCFYKDYSINTLKNMEGLIVSANKDSYTSISGSITQGLSAITINESLPDISLCNKEKDKAVFGVISTTEDPSKREDSYGSFVTPFEKEVGDTRPYINSVGEGAIWVSNKNNNLESGDYITSSSIPGYGMKQDDDLLHNYTVAKITMNCNFSPQIVPKRIILKDSNGDNILDSNGYVQFVDHASETELKYNIRFLKDDGTIINESEYNTRLGNGESVYKAAFVGCTYHCG